jgi:hypothetical protein
MSRVKFDEKKINERIRQGYGQGEGKDYIPWLVVGDFSSQGQCNRVLGATTGREHHFFSKLEFNYFNLLDWCDEIVDIREQVPLFPVSETESIAYSLGYKHPRDNNLSNNAVMTTDFLYSVRRSGEITLHARSVKYWADAVKPRTLEKLSIERAYWNNRGIDFDVITEQCIDQEKCASLRRFLDHYPFCLSGIIEERNIDIHARILMDRLLESDERLITILHQIENENQFSDGSMLSFFYYLVAHKTIPITFSGKFLPSKQIKELIDLPKLRSILIGEALKDGTSC